MSVVSGGKLLPEIGSEELEELGRSGDVLQPVASQRSKRSTRERLVTTDVVSCLRHDDLLAMGRGADAGGDDDVHADVPLVAEFWLARVHTDSESMSFVVLPWLRCERALYRSGSRKRVPCT